jgi:hypothetical protein
MTAEWCVRGGGTTPRAATGRHSRRDMLYAHSPLSVLLLVEPPKHTSWSPPSHVSEWPRRGLGPLPRGLTSTHSQCGAALAPALPALAPLAAPLLPALLVLHADSGPSWRAAGAYAQPRPGTSRQ